MQRLVTIAAMILALVALGMPSLSLGMGIGAGAPVHVSAGADTAADSAALARPHGCKSLGGKRVLPCHPDLGVMAGRDSAAMPPLRYSAGPNAVLPLPARAPEAELPPPRQA